MLGNRPNRAELNVGTMQNEINALREYRDTLHDTLKRLVQCAASALSNDDELRNNLSFIANQLAAQKREPAHGEEDLLVTEKLRIELDDALLRAQEATSAHEALRAEVDELQKRATDASNRADCAEKRAASAIADKKFASRSANEHRFLAANKIRSLIEEVTGLQSALTLSAVQREIERMTESNLCETLNARVKNVERALEAAMRQSREIAKMGLKLDEATRDRDSALEEARVNFVEREKIREELEAAREEGELAREAHEATKLSLSLSREECKRLGSEVERLSRKLEALQGSSNQGVGDGEGPRAEESCPPPRPSKFVQYLNNRRG